MKSLSDIPVLFSRETSCRRFALVVGVWFAVLLAAVNVRVPINDNIPNVLIPVSLLREGNLELSEFTALRQQEPAGERYWAVKTPAGMYAKYPIWTGVLVSPLFVPGVLFGWGLDADAPWLITGKVAALLLAAIGAAILAAGLRVRAGTTWALLLTFAALFGSALWHHLASHLTNQSLAVVCVAALAVLLMDGSMSRTKALTIGVLAGLATAARPAALPLAVIPLGVFVTAAPWRRYLGFVAGGAALFPVLTLWYNTVAFGAPLNTGYDFAVVPQRFDAPFADGALGLLFSPTCGLFFYSPYLLVLLVGLFIVRKDVVRLGHVGVVMWLLLGCVGQWLLFSKWYCWNGGLSYGCRMLTELVPVLIVLGGLCHTLIKRSRWFRCALLVTIALAVLTHLLGTVTYDAVAANNPIKSNWAFSADFVWLFVQQFGPQALMSAVASAVALLGVGVIAGGYFFLRIIEDEKPVLNYEI